MQGTYFVLLRNSIVIEQKLFQSLVFATFTIASLILANLGLSAKADTQSLKVNNQEVNNYARSVLLIEPKRQQAFEEIKKLIGSKEIPTIVCNNPSSMNSLPTPAKDIAVNYCNDSQQIVEENKLTSERFNAITLELKNNGDLKQKIYNTLIRLQNEAASKTGTANVP